MKLGNPIGTTTTVRITPRIKKIVLVVLACVLALVACTSSEYDAREAQQKEKEEQTANTQEKANLREKIKRDEASANKVGYVYVMSFGEFVGYYTIKGKISSNGSQITPEDNVLCPYETGESCLTTDGVQDDGTYGEGDPGIFFFTTEGAMVVTSLDYLYADQPITAPGIQVPKLNS